MNRFSPNATVMVGLSGGVDSSVAALLLKQRGYRVQAIHMTNWDGDEDQYCQAADDLNDAREVADLLDIPLHHVNFAEDYKQQVFDEFLADYAAGLTPNPDVLCNREIKFGVYLNYARRLGADAIATGHYARVSLHDNAAQLRLAADTHKDQTYFLLAISQAALAKTLFPLGDLTKQQVRQLAAQAGLPTRDKKDSTGICFVGERPFREFLSRYLAVPAGPIKTLDGREIGRHHGAIYYTVGQRKGLGIGGVRDANDEPWFVAHRDVASNTLVVVQGKRHPDLYRQSLTTEEPTWIAGGAPEALNDGQLVEGFRGRIRHGQRLDSCSVRYCSGALEVEFDEPQWAVAGGQFLALYHGDICLGGAKIQPSERDRVPLLKQLG